MEIFNLFMNPRAIITTLGVIGVIAIIFMETGLFFGFFFPGDSLLFMAGYLSSQGYASLAVLLVGTFVAAVLGDTVGYAFGKKVGPSIFNKDDSVFFNKKHIEKAKDFYDKHGRKTIILARFLPIVRTFAPIVAGVANMEYKTFISFNVIGGFLWTWIMLWLGYIFGSVIPDPDKYILPIIVLIILISAVPTLREIFRKRQI